MIPDIVTLEVATNWLVGGLLTGSIIGLVAVLIRVRG